MEFQVFAFPVAAVVFLASFIQGASGFGFGIIAVPLLTAFYLKPEVALPLCSVAAVFQALIGAVRYRREVNIKEILVLCLYCTIGSVLGVLTLRWVTSFNPELFGMVVGVLLIIVVSLKILLRTEPKEGASVFWKIAALFSGGYISGLAGVGGPLIVLWVMAHQWESIRYRVTLWFLFLSITMVQSVMFFFIFGRDALYGAAMGVVFVPVVALGTLVGILAGNRLDTGKFYRVVFGMIYLISFYSILRTFL